MYVNGTLSGGTSQNAGAIRPGSDLYIGRRPAAAYPFEGMIDDVRIYNRALDTKEIMQIYTAGGGVPAPVLHTLTVSAVGSGSVSSNPAGINCGSTCSVTLTENTSIILNPVPSSGSTFSGWSGGSCTGTGACIFSLNTDTSVTATFTSDTVNYETPQPVENFFMPNNLSLLSFEA
jgi:hypothetical protein